MPELGRDITGDLELAESREWLCTNGLGGFAMGTVAGSLARRYHGLLVAAISPPLGRVLMVAKLEEIVSYGGERWELSANRWSGGTVAPAGQRFVERFRLGHGAPVWTYACADALLEKRVWVEQGANTTYVSYRVRRATGPLQLEVKALVNYRDYHATTRAEGWNMRVQAVPAGFVVHAFDGARPLTMAATGATAEMQNQWYRGYEPRRESERGLDHADDHLHAGTFRVALAPGGSITVIASAEAAPSLEGVSAWERHERSYRTLLDAWEKAEPVAARAPGWVRQLVLAAAQFVVKRATPEAPDGLTVIAGYPWFGDWGRDTMIALPGLSLITGRPEVARKVLEMFAHHVDQGMLPNCFSDGSLAAGYNSVDAALWFVEAVRAYHGATGDDGFLATLYPVLADSIAWHRKGTRYGIHEDRADGLLHSGEAGVQVTWMDVKIGDWVVTPRTGKAVEINALWHNALRAMAAFARTLGRPAADWERGAARVAASFDRFWNGASRCCFDVLDGPAGHDGSIRPNQIFAVSLPTSPLGRERQRAVVDVCARRLLTSFGLRSLDPDHPDYKPRYAGPPHDRDAAYHQGTVWGWLLGPFALAHFKVHGDREAALALLEPLGRHVGAYGVGSLGEIFDAEAPHAPRGCPFQAWTVAETLRAWAELAGDGAGRRSR